MSDTHCPIVRHPASLAAVPLTRRVQGAPGRG